MTPARTETTLAAPVYWAEWILTSPAYWAILAVISLAFGWNALPS